jgi:hypothetical protein
MSVEMLLVGAVPPQFAAVVHVELVVPVQDLVTALAVVAIARNAPDTSRSFVQVQGLK